MIVLKNFLELTLLGGQSLSVIYFIAKLFSAEHKCNEIKTIEITSAIVSSCRYKDRYLNWTWWKLQVRMLSIWTKWRILSILQGRLVDYLSINHRDRRHLFLKDTAHFRYFFLFCDNEDYRSCDDNNSASICIAEFKHDLN